MRRLTLTFLLVWAWIPFAFGNPDPDEQVVLHQPEAPLPVTIKVEKLGFSNARLEEAVTQALNTNQVLGVLNDSDHRVLRVDFQESSSCNGKTVSPESFKAEVFDYTNGRAVYLNGDVFSPASSVSIEETGNQPLPSPEEIAEAAKIAGYTDKATAFAAMPPVISRVFPNGTSHRVLHIMAKEAGSTVVKQLYVNLNNKTFEVETHSSSAPPPPTCNAPTEAGQGVTPRGTPGQALVTISQGGVVLWTMEVTRPSASSGSAGSGVELRNVRYKGRTVLYQAHVPILDVEYKQSVPGCGPTYRDWQNEEYPLKCPGSDVPGVPNFRICTAPPTTIVDPPNTDGGDFTGVALYADQSTGTVVIKSQLRAGWYRYTSEWRLGVDGSILPRFGFGGVYWPSSGCICVPHHHHVYWRLDFDIETAAGNKVTEFNRRIFPLPGTGTTSNDVVFEVQRPKALPLLFHRHWEVSNIQTGRGYALFPGVNDGTSDAYGVGDLWVLRYNGAEIDDGPVAYPDTSAKIGKYVNGESVLGADVVVWYGAHFLHDEGHEGGGQSHVVGPTLSPVAW